MHCPCGTQKPYESCCGLFIEGKSLPQTALELMRSRYTAFTLNNTDYIGKTQKGKAAERYSPEQTSAWIQTCEWLGLEIVDTQILSETKATVSFKAHFKEDGIPRVIQENSLFEFDGTKWYYTQGQQLTHKADQKIGRNDPCSCGSGQKYKKCCGRG